MLNNTIMQLTCLASPVAVISTGGNVPTPSSAIPGKADPNDEPINATDSILDIMSLRGIVVCWLLSSRADKQSGLETEVFVSNDDTQASTKGTARHNTATLQHFPIVIVGMSNKDEEIIRGGENVVRH